MKTLIACLALSGAAFAQIQIDDENPITIDFAGYTAAGFAPTPAAGQLDSDHFRVTGLSDGDLAFGGTGTSGDYTRGTSAGGTSSGGVYGGTATASAPFIFFQPSGSDFNPGTFTIRFQNNNAQAITDIDISYTIKVNNDQPRANSWNFSYSTNDSSYTSVPALNYTSPDAADANGFVDVARMDSISGLNIPNGGFFYIQFSSADVSGGGSRDEIGVDDIVITATNLPVELEAFSVE